MQICKYKCVFNCINVRIVLSSDSSSLFQYIVALAIDASANSNNGRNIRSGGISNFTRERVSETQRGGGGDSLKPRWECVRDKIRYLVRCNLIYSHAQSITCTKYACHRSTRIFYGSRQKRNAWYYRYERTISDQRATWNSVVVFRINKLLRERNVSIILWYVFLKIPHLTMLTSE